jgi:hypothetical protein
MEREIILIKNSDSTSKSRKREENAKVQRQRCDNHTTQELTEPKRSTGRNSQDSSDRRLQPSNQMNLGTHRSSITNESKHNTF